MKIKKTGFTALLLMLVLTATAQKSRITAADRKYDEYAYVDAITLYEKVAAKGYKDEKMFQRLANAYYFNAELIKAVKWYDSLFEINPEQDPEYFYRYAQSLKSVGNYIKADEMLDNFSRKMRSDKRGTLIENNKNYLEKIKTNSNRYDITDAGINSKMSDYGSTIYNDKIVFASTRDTGGVTKKIFKWTNKYFSNLYIADLLPDGSLGKPKPFERKINSKFNESTPVFTQDGKTMYFTRNNYVDGKRQLDDQKVTLLKLYQATLVNEKWQNITELPFNSNQYSVAHPALSTDGKTLYFASDMPGTLGNSDLFRVTINNDGTFGSPENLGAAINTEGRETFPFVSAENELYFASDGRPGLGGLDVFVSKINSDSGFEEVENVGAPINTQQDDFAFIINKDRNGFFTSNRENGKGLDDIYRLKETRRLTCEQVLRGTVYDLTTGEILPGSKIVLRDEKFNPITQSTSDEKGNYVFTEVECNKNYYVKVSKADYETQEKPVTIDGTSGETILKIQLQKRIIPIAVGTDLAKTLDIPIIYFDLDKAIIKDEAAFQLQKIVEIVEQYPNMILDIRSHTDSRQSKKYNQGLSEKRAQATMKWLIDKGVNPDHLKGKGYGESRLLNKCSDGVNCSEEEHQLNRRSEFIILSM